MWTNFDLRNPKLDRFGSLNQNVDLKKPQLEPILTQKPKCGQILTYPNPKLDKFGSLNQNFDLEKPLLEHILTSKPKCGQFLTKKPNCTQMLTLKMLNFDTF